MVAEATLIALLVAAVKGFSVVVAAFVALAVMVAALMAFAVMVVVVVAAGVGIVVQLALRQRPGRRVRGALHAAVELDPGVGQGHLRPHADAAADQAVRPGCLQEARQSAIAAAVGINDL